MTKILLYRGSDLSLSLRKGHRMNEGDLNNGRAYKLLTFMLKLFIMNHQVQPRAWFGSNWHLCSTCRPVEAKGGHEFDRAPCIDVAEVKLESCLRGSALLCLHRLWHCVF